MALSDWDALAVDETGEPIVARFTTPKGVAVVVNKNWLEVTDKALAPLDTPRDEEYGPEVHLVVREGKLRYRDLSICAVRGPQDGLYAAVWSWDGEDNRHLLGMACIGCQAYEFPSDAPQGIASWGGRREDLPKREKKIVESMEKDGWKVVFDGEDDGIQLVGVKPESVAFLQTLLCETDGHPDYPCSTHDIPKELWTLDLSKALRYNQGDAFFVSHSNLLDDLPATPPGEPLTPFIMAAMEQSADAG